MEVKMNLKKRVLRMEKIDEENAKRLKMDTDKAKRMTLLMLAASDPIKEWGRQEVNHYKQKYEERGEHIFHLLNCRNNWMQEARRNRDDAESERILKEMTMIDLENTRLREQALRHSYNKMKEYALWLEERMKEKEPRRILPTCILRIASNVDQRNTIIEEDGLEYGTSDGFDWSPLPETSEEENAYDSDVTVLSEDLMNQ
jgi:hypothetical protein